MAEVHAPPQPGSPEQAPHMLPLGAFGWFLLVGGIFVVIAGLIFIWLARGIFADQFVAIDDGILTWMHGYWSPMNQEIALSFTTLGEPVTLGVFIVLAAFGLWRRGRWIDAFGLLLAAGGGGLANQALKFAFQRTRPDLFEGPFYLTSYSFPSGHAMGAITCYGMLAFVAIRLVRGRLVRAGLALAAALLTLGVGLSRVYFGVHYPTDVIGAYIAGAIWLVFTLGVVRAAEWRARRHERLGGMRSASSAKIERR